MPARCSQRSAAARSPSCTPPRGSAYAAWPIPSSSATWISVWPAARSRCSAASTIRSERPARQGGRIRVHACGVCHSDSMVVSGHMPGLTYPRIPGHEVIGTIEAVGADVEGWRVGTRVGVGWHSGACGHCGRCRHGNSFACENVQGATGITRDGGYATHMLARASALARLPEDMDPVESAPLLCAGITTFNALRHCGARPGDLVAIHGVGGLGHLAIQFAARQGLRTVAVNRGRDKEQLARSLGAQDYIDSERSDPAAALQALGGEIGRAHV